MLYTIAIQNLRLQVSIPDSADTAVLDKVVREFNDHLMTFNGGRPVKLFESKEVRLLIFTLISFILGLQKKQEELEEGLKEKPVHVSTKESEKVSNRNDSETIETIKKLISLCDRGLTNRSFRKILVVISITQTRIFKI